MSGLAQRNVHGPVHTLRIESAEWDVSLKQWQASKSFTFVRFHPDGRIHESESHNPDGSISQSSYAYDAVGRMQEARFGMNGDPISKNIYFYDERGRLTRVVSVDRDGTDRESEAYSYGQDGKKTKVCFIPKQGPNAGSVRIAVTALSAGDTDEVLLRDDDHRLLSPVIFTRDSAGRLISAQMHFGEQIPFPHVERELENATPEAREAFVKVFGPNNVMSSTTYTYDGKGLLRERSTRTWGSLAVIARRSGTTITTIRLKRPMNTPHAGCRLMRMGIFIPRKRLQIDRACVLNTSMTHSATGQSELFGATWSRTRTSSLRTSRAGRLPTTRADGPAIQFASRSD